MKAALAVLVVLSAASVSVQAASPAVPWTHTTILGSRTSPGAPAVTYRAYKEPAEPFRILCQEPCSISEQLIFAEYEGFKKAKAQLLALAGIDILPSMRPYDMHLAGDSWCGPYTQGLTGDAGTYPAASGQTGSVSCFWFVEKINLAVPFTVENAAGVEFQLLPVHEYGHVLFYGRHFLSYEDMVKAFSFYVSGISPDGKITDACHERLNGVSQGKLVYSLCRNNGFNFGHLAPSLQQLAAVHQAGQGLLSSGNTSVLQYRRILNGILGENTADAFLAAGWPPRVVGDDVQLTTGHLRPVSGWVRLAVPSVPSPRALAIDMYDTSTTWPDLDFDRIFVLKFDGPLASPIHASFEYDPFQVGRESLLRLYRRDFPCAGNCPWQPVAGSRVDALESTVDGPIASTGMYALLHASQSTDPDDNRWIIPVAASVRGGFGSDFKTAVQLSNPTSYTVSGRFIFRQGGRAGSDADPSRTFSLPPRTSQTFPDLLETMGVTGLGSLDVVLNVTLQGTDGIPPDIVARVYNDLGDSGTTGLAEEALPAEGALQAGERGVLIAPDELTTKRFNIGLRTLSGGANVRITVRSWSGAPAAVIDRNYPAHYFEQQSSRDFLGGLNLSGSESIEFSVTAGSLFVYGATTDNRTNDPSMQLARRPSIAPVTPNELRFLPTVASVNGGHGSLFRTSLQLHNASDGPVSGRLVFHQKGRSAAPSDPSITFSLSARETRAYPDIVAAMGQSDLGSVDLFTTSGAAPLAVARVYNDGGAGGTTGLTEELLTTARPVRAGQIAALFAPANVTTHRLNIGIRTLDRGARVRAMLRGSNGQLLKTVDKTFAPGWFEQSSATDFLGGTAPPANSFIIFSMEEGDALIYGATNDNRTNDPAMQIARTWPVYLQ